MKGSVDVEDMLDFAIKVVKSLLEESPGISGEEVLAKLENLANKYLLTRPRSSCAHCHAPIVQIVGGDWVHDTEYLTKGCRAASFDRLGDWDNSLSRNWYAKLPNDPQL